MSQLDASSGLKQRLRRSVPSHAFGYVPKQQLHQHASLSSHGKQFYGNA